MDKLYLYLLKTAVNWWRSLTCICSGQLWTDGEALPVSAVDSCELKLYLYLLWTAVSWWRSCTCICCGQLWTDGEAIPVSAVDRTDGEALPVSAVDSCELMEKLYLYLLWTAKNWWRSFTCICCGQLCHIWTMCSAIGTLNSSFFSMSKKNLPWNQIAIEPKASG